MIFHVFLNENEVILMKFSEFLEEMGYELTEYQKEMADLFQKEGVLLQIPRLNGKTTLLKEYYKYKLNKKVLTNRKWHGNIDI